MVFNVSHFVSALFSRVGMRFLPTQLITQSTYSPSNYTLYDNKIQICYGFWKYFTYICSVLRQVNQRTGIILHKNFVQLESQ